MNLSFKKQFFRFLALLIPISLILYALQYTITAYAFPSTNFYLKTWAIYIFHFSITTAILAALIAISKVLYDKVGFAFVAGSLLKMFASLVFLIPLIKAPVPSKIPDAFAFFIPYFIFLGIETYFTLRILRTGEPVKNETEG